MFLLVFVQFLLLFIIYFSTLFQLYQIDTIYTLFSTILSFVLHLISGKISFHFINDDRCNWCDIFLSFYLINCSLARKLCRSCSEVNGWFSIKDNVDTHLQNVQHFDKNLPLVAMILYALTLIFDRFNYLIG